MATTKKYDVAVKTGSYTDRDGNEKARYENVGTVLQTDKGPFMLLKRSFNPAGVPFKDGGDTIMLSFFEPKDGQGNSQNNSPNPQKGAQNGPPPSFDDAPF